MSLFYPMAEYQWSRKYVVIDEYQMDFCEWDCLVNKSKIARNEIFARHGYVFKTAEMKDYFERQGWYKPNKRFSVESLNDVEKRNVEYLKIFEELVANKVDNRKVWDWLRGPWEKEVK